LEFAIFVVPGQSLRADPPLDLAPCFESNELAEARFVADPLIDEGVPQEVTRSSMDDRLVP